MKYVIPKGRHHSKPRLFALWLMGKRGIVYDVCFDRSCKYDLNPKRKQGALDPENENYNPDDPQFDWNKLFGIGYFPHHKESARYVWRYNIPIGKIQLASYCYVKGELIIKELCSVPFFRWYRLTLVVFNDEYYFEVTDMSTGLNIIANTHIEKSHNKKFSFKLGLYFGGDRKAPQGIIVDMKKIK